MKSPAVLSAFKKRKQTEEEHRRELHRQESHQRSSLPRENRQRLENPAQEKPRRLFEQVNRPSVTEQLVRMWQSIRNLAGAFW